MILKDATGELLKFKKQKEQIQAGNLSRIAL
jgi:hypothetical protein